MTSDDVSSQARPRQDDAAAESSIAVVGMAGRFPGANSVAELWRMLVEAREGVTFFADADIDPAVPAEQRRHPNYVAAKGVVADADCFDATFFSLSPMEAKVMDPQQRLSLEVCWHALEDAAIVADTYDGVIGVYAGCNWNRYRKSNLANTKAESAFGDFNVSLANEPEFLATRLAYKLNLKGPAVSVSSACSTSLVAVAEACKALFAFDCDVALAGGASITTPLNAGYMYQEGSMLSKDGHCRSFDASAAGTTFNDGVAYVALKRTEDALRDGDRIYATVRGFAVNNDGADKVSFTAPSVGGQAAAIANALEYADIDPATIRLIEAHGTATPMGDPIEVAALKQAFEGVTATSHCAIGSVKSNVGHLVHAAGVTGFIKAVLSVREGVLPASLFFEQENPRLELAQSPFYVNAATSPWPDDPHPRRAGISSFGVGGTNAHVIVEQPPDPVAAGHDVAPQLMPVSAKTPEALTTQLDEISAWARLYPAATVAAVADAYQRGRVSMACRAAWVVKDRASLAPDVLDASALHRGKALEQPQTAFMFTGQGAQRPGMASVQAGQSSEFARWWHAGLAYLAAKADTDLSSALAEPVDSDDPAIQQTALAQPALYLFEYAMARALMSAGVQPDVLVGHSIGEFAAAALAGVFDFETGLEIVTRRGQLMQAQPAGAMVAVFADLETAKAELADSLAIAAQNAPQVVVLSGAFEDIEALEKRLDHAQIRYKRIKTSHAFHSSLMTPAASDFRDYLSSVTLSSPSIPIVSTVTASYLTDAQATSADYWAEQLLEPVRFADAIAFCAEASPVVALEVGPGATLATMATMSATSDRLVVHACCPDAATTSAEQHAALNAAAFVWANGGNILLASQQPQHQPDWPLPGYSFERVRHWVDPVALERAPASQHVADPAAAATALQRSDTLPTFETTEVTMSDEEHRQALIERIVGVLEDVSGFSLDDCEPDAEFLDVGFDSILLTQAALSVQQEFGVDITFRQLMEDFTSIGTLADFLAEHVEPPKKTLTAPVANPATVTHAAAPTMTTTGAMLPAASGDIQGLVQQQLDIMRQQLAVLSGQVAAVADAPSVPAGGATQADIAPPMSATEETAAPEQDAIAKKKAGPAAKKSEGPGTRIQRTRSEKQVLTQAQQKYIRNLEQQYVEATQKSKAFVSENRSILADPRTVSGFSPALKEMVYPIVTDRSKGSKIFDIDDREYIDITNGFGPIFFGHSPDFVNEAVIEQIRKGIETGPQSPLAGETARLCAEITGNERIAFANTGSEAVCCALRLARTVTGRSKVVVFEGAYHGIFDEVVVRPGRDGAGLPAAPGIPREMTQNIVVLPWADDASLDRIRDMGDELAAVMVEPVQSRNPGVQPGAFLKGLRELTETSGAALIFDEIVTGFRVAPGGAQEHFGIRADLASYGKVVGGGYPIGIIGGKARFMDALDGGPWQFGDDSVPQVGVTFFAGTFVRHPVALAASLAVLKTLKAEGPSLQQGLTDKTTALVDDLAAYLETIGCPVTVKCFSSYFYISVPEQEAHGALLFYLLRLYGIHAWQYRPCFITASHSQADIAAIAKAFKRSIAELVRHGLLTGDAVALERLTRSDSDAPPVPGARLGKDESGAPAWFVPDPDNPGGYKIVGRKSVS